MANLTSLAGKRVLITGGAGGVGRAVAAQFLSHGARILITDRDGETLEQVAHGLRKVEPGGEVAWALADLSGPTGADALFAEVDESLGGLDILVACAGVGAGPLMDVDDGEWRYAIESNLMSSIACTQRAVARMRKSDSRDGIVILVGSISVHIKAVGESVFNAAKGGIASFAETLRKELMADSIRVTLIEPGAICTAMQASSPEQRAQVDGYRMLRPDAVADAILFAATRGPGVDVATLRIEPLALQM
ncbi:SDR family oxidoreductase [Sphingomonas sp.]|uniref:SDR family oxidoreductase n=1 Tax=Sphingomonas sp. TaxID=28214 RepID=UPI002E1302F6|nr:SDR family oxidoreductase [Sphingomonas sp.]